MPQGKRPGGRFSSAYGVQGQHQKRALFSCPLAGAITMGPRDGVCASVPPEGFSAILAEKEVAKTMLKCAAAVIVMLACSLPCRADTFADTWNSSGVSDHAFFLAGWATGVLDVCGTKGGDLCTLVKSDFELSQLERLVSLIYEEPMFQDLKNTFIFAESLRYLEGRSSADELVHRLAAAARKGGAYSAPREEAAGRHRKPAPRPREKARGAQEKEKGGGEAETGRIQQLLREAGNL